MDKKRMNECNDVADEATMIVYSSPVVGGCVVRYLKLNLKSAGSIFTECVVMACRLKIVN